MSLLLAGVDIPQELFWEGLVTQEFSIDLHFCNDYLPLQIVFSLLTTTDSRIAITLTTSDFLNDFDVGRHKLPLTSACFRQSDSSFFPRSQKVYKMRRTRGCQCPTSKYKGNCNLLRLLSVGFEGRRPLYQRYR